MAAILSNSTVELRSDARNKRAQLAIIIDGKDVHTCTFTAEQMLHHAKQAGRCCRDLGIDESLIIRPSLGRVKS